MFLPLIQETGAHVDRRFVVSYIDGMENSTELIGLVGRDQLEDGAYDDWLHGIALKHALISLENIPPRLTSI